MIDFTWLLNQDAPGSQENLQQEIIVDTLFEEGYMTTLLEKDGWVWYRFNSVNPNNKLEFFDMSTHLFFQIFFEFISMDWIIQTTFDLMRQELDDSINGNRT